MPRYLTVATAPPRRPAAVPAYGLLEVGRGHCYMFQQLLIDGAPLKRITIGRSPHADIRVQDEGASWSHAVLTSTDSGYVLFDCQSANGVYVDYVKLGKPTVLNVGMQVHFGGALFVATDEDGKVPLTAVDYTHLGQRAVTMYGSPEAAAPKLNRSPGVLRRQLQRLWCRGKK